VVAATAGVVPILADFSDRANSPQHLTQKYGVKGFPAVVFLDHTGKKVEDMRSRDAGPIKTQLDAVVNKYTVEVFSEAPIAEAKAAAVEKGKLLMLVLLTDDKAKSKPKNAALMAALMGDDLEAIRGKALLVKRPLRDGKKVTEEAKTYGASKSPTLLVLDPNSEEEGKKTVLKKITGAKNLRKALAKVLKKAEKNASK
jgi:hypothetical protein